MCLSGYTHRYGSCSIVGYVNDQPIIVCFTDNWNTPAPTTGWEEFPGGGEGGGSLSDTGQNQRQQQCDPGFFDATNEPKY